MTTFKSLSDRAVSTLASGITNVATSLTVASGEGAKFPASNFWVTIEDEIILVGSRSVDTFSSLTRAQNGTSAAAHSASVAIAANLVTQHIDDITGAIGTLETAPPGHAASHQNGGGDEISVAGLSGLLADDQHVIDAEVDARITAAIGSSVQAHDADLDDIAALSSADGNFIVGSATGWVAESGATARTSLGVGSIGTLSEVTLGTHTGGNYVADITAGNLIDVSGGGVETATITINVDLSELTDMTVAEVGTDELVILDAGVQKRKAINEINLSSFNDDLGYAAGDITAVTAGTGLSGGGTEGAVTLDVDLNELTTSVSDGDGDYFVVVDTIGGQKKLTKANIALSGFNNDSGWTSNTGDITGVTAGTGLSGGGSSGSVTLDVDLNELTTSVADGDGDYFVVVDTIGGQKKLTKANIALSGFNNDSGWTSNTGDITGVTAGNGLTGGGASGSVTVTVGAGTGITVNASDVAVSAAQTGITSMYNTSLLVGRDADNRFDFATDNVIKVKVNAVDDEFRFAAGGHFHADGDVYAYSTTTASDRNLKTNIVPIYDPLSKINRLTGYTFDYLDQARGSSVGLIAQEVQAIFPELVKEVPELKTDGTYLTLNYDGVIGLLVEAVNALSERVS